MAYDLIAVASPATPATEGAHSRSSVYRSKAHPVAPSRPGVTTLYELFTGSVENFRDQPLLGHRPIDAQGVAGDYVWITYGETARRSNAIASSLAAAGVGKGQRVAVFGANCPEWMISMQACNRMGYQCVPLYDSLGENAIEYIIDHSEASFLFVSGAKLPDFVGALPKIKQALKGVVFWGDAPASAIASAEAHGLSVTPFEAFLTAGAAAPVLANPPAATDYCTVMYTSGTTGDPKGVLLTHAAVVATTMGLLAYLEDVDLKMGPGDSMLSYLPLAHIFDRTAEESFISFGGKIGYWQGDIKTLVQDIGALKPTMFVGVPRVYDRIHNGVMDKISKGGCLVGFLFKMGFNGKLNRLRAGYPSESASKFWDKVVFGKIKERLGGKVRVIVSGGAPLAEHVEDFLKVAMCAPVVQGYGLTETCAASFISMPNTPKSGVVGPPQPHTTFCLESVPEMKYDALADTPRGELLLRGPNNFAGYFKMDDKTEEVLEKDGWFHTGDVAEIQADGNLKIIDRKKNIFKLAQGEYIAVEKLESEFKKCAEVNQIWVYGDSFESCIIAVAVPNEERFMAWASANKVPGSFAEVCASQAGKAHMLACLRDQAKLSKLKGFEVIKAVHLDNEEFSVEGDTLTPTFKLRRPQLKDKYMPVLTAMYKSLK